jgi:hypothetical protein
MTDELHVVAGLRRQLLALPDRRAPRRAPTLALAALAVVAAALGALALADRGADEAIAVSRQGDVTEIRVLDAQADPARLTAELRDQGVDATIRTQPVAPELVGQWYSVIYNAREPSGGQHVPVPGFRVEGDVVRFSTPLRVDIVLVLGVPGG